MKTFYFLAISIFLSSCVTQKLEVSQINFEAGLCFGTCPVFTMEITGEGSAQYYAKMYNEREGQFKAIVKRPQLDSLTQLIEKSGLFSLKNEYSTDWTDHPTYVLTVKLKNGQSKTINDYGPSGPDKLKELYHFIFSLRQNQDWK